MIVNVALPIPVAKTFSYAVPEKWTPLAERFSRVKVPFHNRVMTGFIVGVDEGDADNLRAIGHIIDPFPLIDGTLAQLCEFAADYYVAPLGMILRHVLPAGLRLENHVAVKVLAENISYLDGFTLKQAIKAVGQNRVLRLFREGALRFQDVFTGLSFEPWSNRCAPGGIAKKNLYLGNIDERLEYYIKHIAEQIGTGKNVLMLLPDYHGAGQFFYGKLREKFGGSVVWYGSAVRPKTRTETYFKARSGTGFLILGNKSSVFLPLKNNGLVIVERHEEDEYRNEEGFKFNAGLMALRRAEIENIPAIFGSASPSAEMFKHGVDGRLAFVEGGWIARRKYSVIRQGWRTLQSGILSKEMTDIMDEAIAREEKIAIFTPRRDYGSSIRCLECKESILCPLCDGVLSYQRKGNRLVCPNCNKSYDFKAECPSCGSSLIHTAYMGAEFIEEKLKVIYGDSRIIRVSGETSKENVRALKMTSDTGGLVFVGSRALSKLYTVRVDRLILVGWENMVRLAGYRADEKMFQLLINLVDALSPGELYFFMDEKIAVNPARYFDLKAFYAEEMRKRELAGFPPYVRFFLIEVERKGEKEGLKVCDKIAKILQESGLSDFVAGPKKLRKKGSHRWRFVLKGNEDLLRTALLSIYDLPGVQIEADPPNI
jgi:primosomal protein N' (replication factor Y) (superfamily II helicase)